LRAVGLKHLNDRTAYTGRIFLSSLKCRPLESAAGGACPLRPLLPPPLVTSRLHAYLPPWSQWSVSVSFAELFLQYYRTPIKQSIKTHLYNTKFCELIRAYSSLYYARFCSITLFSYFTVYRSVLFFMRCVTMRPICAASWSFATRVHFYCVAACPSFCQTVCL